MPSKTFPHEASSYPVSPHIKKHWHVYHLRFLLLRIFSIKPKIVMMTSWESLYLGLLGLCIYAPGPSYIITVSGWLQVVYNVHSIHDLWYVLYLVILSVTPHHPYSYEVRLASRIVSLVVLVDGGIEHRFLALAITPQSLVWFVNYILKIYCASVLSKTFPIRD